MDVARANATRAGLGAHLRFDIGELGEARPPSAHGLLVANPPYGERLGEAARLTPLYAQLGQVLRQHFGGWHAAVFTANPEAARGLGLPVERQHTLYNGALACRLSLHALTGGNHDTDATAAPGTPPVTAPDPDSNQAAKAHTGPGAKPGTPAQAATSPWPATLPTPRTPVDTHARPNAVASASPDGARTQDSTAKVDPAPVSRPSSKPGAPDALGVPDTHGAGHTPHSPPAPPAASRSAGATMFANRLRKNLRHLSRWARRQGVDCYRVYDADLPDYALAVDLYQGEPGNANAPTGRWLHVQEYQAPASIDPARAEARLGEALGVLAETLAIPLEQIYFKLRKRQKGSAQYTRQGETRDFHVVREGALRFLVNFSDYLDTGLFLDHRQTRTLIGELAQDQDVLNLFCYTGTATVHAAAGGARSTTSIDMSRTSLDWARRNLLLNHFNGPEHQRVQADCLHWLEEAARAQTRHYGLIFLDPPSFSNSKRMETSFDIQRDQAALLGQAVQLLSPDGVLIFSTNRRQFKLDPAVSTLLEQSDLRCEELTRATLPEDFKRGTPIHRCWKILRASPT